MSALHLSIAAALTLGGLTATAPTASAATTNGTDRIVRVTDGDTVVLAKLGKTRLIGVDTPEVYGGAECFGAQASAYTKRLLPPGTRVRYVLDRDDKYGRALIYLAKGSISVQEQLLRGGYATTLSIAPNTSRAARYARLQQTTMAPHRGLWAAATCTGNPDLPFSAPTPSEPVTTAPIDDRDCLDFTTQAEARTYYVSRDGPAQDPDRLDGVNRDARICETLP